MVDPPRELTLGRLFRVQREYMYPKPAKDVSQVRLLIMQWVELKAMMSELEKDAKIPDLWRMSTLLEICLKDMKEQMMMRLGEIGENYENLKAKVVSYTTNKTEQAQGGQKEMYVSMEVDHVSGSEPEEEDWEDVDEVRRVLFVLETIRTGAMRVVHITVKTKETQRLRIKFVLFMLSNTNKSTIPSVNRSMILATNLPFPSVNKSTHLAAGRHRHPWIPGMRACLAVDDSSKDEERNPDTASLRA